MKPIRFKLRTPFLILTTIAVALGYSMLQRRVIAPTEFDSSWIDATISLSVWSEIPFFVVCVMGIIWTLESMSAYPETNRLVLIALTISLFWHGLLDQWIYYTARILISDLDSRFFVQGLIGLFSGTLDAICWLLVLLAYHRKTVA